MFWVYFMFVNGVTVRVRKYCICPPPLPFTMVHYHYRYTCSVKLKSEGAVDLSILNEGSIPKI